MPIDGSGRFTLPPVYLARPGETITAGDNHNTPLEDVASALSAAVYRDGRAAMTGALTLFGNATSDLHAVPKQQLDVAIQSALVIPPGVMWDYAGATAPTGYLLCNGQAVSRATYAALFAAIGTAWGAGDGSTTFNVPDMRGRVAIGKDDMGGTAATRVTLAVAGFDGTILGAAGGAQSVTLTQAQLPITTLTGSVVVTYPQVQYQRAVGGASYQVGASASAFNSYVADLTPQPNNVAHSVSISSFGSGSAHLNVQPSAIVNKIIKT